MSSSQKSEEIEEDYDPVSKKSKIFQVENLVDFFIGHHGALVKQFVNFI